MTNNTDTQAAPTGAWHTDTLSEQYAGYTDEAVIASISSAIRMGALRNPDSNIGVMYRLLVAEATRRDILAMA